MLLSFRSLFPVTALAAFGALLTPSLSFSADLQLAKVFSDHGVLQREVAVPVWGTSKPEAQVTVEFAGQSVTGKATKEGKWKLELKPLKPHSTGNLMTVTSGEEKVEVRNLLVGDIWYASGQSNMEMKLQGCANKIAAIKELAETPETLPIRTLRIGLSDAEKPQADLSAPCAWQIDSPANRMRQSAVAYFFARKLAKETGVPIGIIEGSWGGKPIEGFIPAKEFVRDDKLKPILDFANAEKLEELKSLEGGVIIRNTAGRPGRIYNARVAPVAPYAIKGFIWYQGESNAGRGEDPRNYRLKMRALVEGWQRVWDNSELPLYFVQLPAFNNQATGWIRLREEQRLSLDIPNTGMAVTIDLRDADIHPANKLDVGNRLALLALANTYGKEVPSSGPLFKSAKVEGKTMRVSFNHAEGGLMVATKQGVLPPKKSEDPLAHFELADNEGGWHKAEARIDGSTVLVTSAEVTEPVAVRYACQGAPANANLYNTAGLPASPFCSDLNLLPWPHVAN